MQHTAGQRMTMVLLDLRGSWFTASEFIRQAGVDRTSGYEYIRGLETAGYLETRQREDDGRTEYRVVAADAR